MEFECEYKQKIIMSYIWIVFRYLAISLIAAFFIHDGDIFQSAFFVLMLITLIPLFLWFVNSIISWGAYIFYSKKIQACFWFDVFKKANFPCPNKIEQSPEDYFLKISENDDLPMNMRLEANIYYGQFAFFRAKGLIQDILKYGFSMQAALKMYYNHLSQ